MNNKTAKLLHKFTVAKYGNASHMSLSKKAWNRLNWKSKTGLRQGMKAFIEARRVASEL